ncbi:MAG: hypothetical protein MUP58_03655 [Candidatus Nanohaloarchaeota archaeon QJJ-9]|nr:hypothetical protein [Candidatus Nanohaloarchaeota archaeon QJJ-9]
MESIGKYLESAEKTLEAYDIQVEKADLKIDVESRNFRFNPVETFDPGVEVAQYYPETDEAVIYDQNLVNNALVESYPPARVERLVEKIEVGEIEVDPQKKKKLKNLNQILEGEKKPDIMEENPLVKRNNIVYDILRQKCPGKISQNLEEKYKDLLQLELEGLLVQSDEANRRAELESDFVEVPGYEVLRRLGNVYPTYLELKYGPDQEALEKNKELFNQELKEGISDPTKLYNTALISLDPNYLEKLDKSKEKITEKIEEREETVLGHQEKELELENQLIEVIGDEVFQETEEYYYNQWYDMYAEAISPEAMRDVLIRNGAPREERDRLDGILRELYKERQEHKESVSHYLEELDEMRSEFRSEILEVDESMDQKIQNRIKPAKARLENLSKRIKTTAKRKSDLWKALRRGEISADEKPATIIKKIAKEDRQIDHERLKALIDKFKSQKKKAKA